MAEARQKDVIFTENVTNELELLEFTIDGNVFGINIAKVTEIMQARKIVPMAASHPCVEGVYKPRDKIVTVIDLPKYMGLPSRENSERDIFVLTNFSNINAAFHVHTVEVMHRIKWSDVEKPDTTIYGGNDSLVTGNARIGNRMVTIIDFEKILFDISPVTGLQMSEITDMGDRKRNDKPIVVAEDSAFLKRMLLESMQAAGYTSIHSFSNGQEAWDYLQKARDDCQAQGLPVETKAAAIITDIEMPKMDGFHLTKLVRDDAALGKIPVIVFSSLIDDAMRAQGERVGVSAQLSKPQIGILVSTLDKWVMDKD